MDDRKRRLVRMAGLIAAGAFLVCGCVRGEVGVVLGKAVHICLECIGLG